MTRRRGTRRRLTWIELSLLAGGVTLAAGVGSLWASRCSQPEVQREAESAARTIFVAVESWRAGNPHGCPTLSALVVDEALPGSSRLDDPWGGRFRVRCTGAQAQVFSPGRDGQAGTRDDVSFPRS